MASSIQDSINVGGGSSNSSKNSGKNTQIFQGSLLSSTTRVEAPFIRVEIGGYSFGVYEKSKSVRGQNDMYQYVNEKYPNYVQSLEIKKINGTVNQYTLVLIYPVTEFNDPNFFEKIFSNISQSRIIKIDYGDFVLPSYIYKDEEAIITDIDEQVDVSASTITYTIKATSTAKLTLSGCYTFPPVTNKKPSDIIYEVLYDADYHLTDVFTGMHDKKLVKSKNLIAADDVKTNIPACAGVSTLDYISILVSYMNSTAKESKVGKTNGVYCLTTYEDTTGVFGGPYFRVNKIQQEVTTLNQLCTYNIDIGFPTANIITSFKIKNSDNWSIFYNYNQSNSISNTTKDIDDNGNITTSISPLLTNTKYTLDNRDKSWWTKVTEFPIQAEVTLKGLLKPAILMTYLKVNVWFYGRKHVSSGYYIITSQVDKIDSNGYFTTLGLTKVAADEGY